MVERYDFTLIKNHKDRTRVIDEFCEIITNGNFSASETMQLRNDLVRDYLKSCSVEEKKDND
tara:strand:- start:348 stop:533 length:186 start_codon:yes stop_codon:yes gene_type:complete